MSQRALLLEAQHTTHIEGNLAAIFDAVRENLKVGIKARTVEAPHRITLLNETQF